MNVIFSCSQLALYHKPTPIALFVLKIWLLFSAKARGVKKSTSLIRHKARFVEMRFFGNFCSFFRFCKHFLSGTFQHNRFLADFDINSMVLWFPHHAQVEEALITTRRANDGGLLLPTYCYLNNPFKSNWWMGFASETRSNL